MRYVSTRGRATPVDFRGALVSGLAPDGGLYVPESVPRLPPDWESWSYVNAVAGSLRLFGAGDVSSLVADAASRFSHPDIAPLVEIGHRVVLELFHGPTLSFKDHALQVLARLLASASAQGVALGATSGDTGSAAIEACRGLLPIVILFPDGRVSELQRRQMTTIIEHGVNALAVDGTFDDCQALVKQAFLETPGLLAINSINWTRIAAQVGYYLYAAARVREPFDVVVPTGNFGNAYSAWMAREMGAPIHTILIATNANRYLSNLISSGEGESGAVIPTLAPAMDIQVPSNLERLPADARSGFVAGAVEDGEIRSTIATVELEHGYLLDPHTATAWAVGTRHRSERPQVVVATAHPAKFPEAVSSAIGRQPEMPEALAKILELPESYLTIAPELSALLEVVEGHKY